MRIRTNVMAIIIVVVMLGGVALSSSMGLWQTKTTKIPVKYSVGDAAGQYNPADIKGSYTFANISKLFEIPLEDLGKAFGVPADRLNTFLVKELESMYDSSADGKEIGANSVSIFVALYKGLPIELSEDTYFPESAVEILKGGGSLTPESMKYLDGHLKKTK